MHVWLRDLVFGWRFCEGGRKGGRRRKRRERREFPTTVSEGPFHPQKSSYAQQKSCIQISPAIGLTKLPHRQVGDELPFQGANHKPSSFPAHQRLGSASSGCHTKAQPFSRSQHAGSGDKCCGTWGLQRTWGCQQGFKMQIQFYLSVWV